MAVELSDEASREEMRGYVGVILVNGKEFVAGVDAAVKCLGSGVHNCAIDSVYNPTSDCPQAKSFPIYKGIAPPACNETSHYTLTRLFSSRALALSVERCVLQFCKRRPHMPNRKPPYIPQGEEYLYPYFSLAASTKAFFSSIRCFASPPSPHAFSSAPLEMGEGDPLGTARPLRTAGRASSLSYHARTWGNRPGTSSPLYLAMLTQPTRLMSAMLYVPRGPGPAT